MYYDHDLAESDRKKEESAQKKPQQSKFNPLLPLPLLLNAHSHSRHFSFPHILI